MELNSTWIRKIFILEHKIRNITFNVSVTYTIRFTFYIEMTKTFNNYSIIYGGFYRSMLALKTRHPSFCPQKYFCWFRTILRINSDLFPLKQH
jgi:hypothetical protein